MPVQFLELGREAVELGRCRRVAPAPGAVVSHETRSLQGRQPVLDHRGARPEVTHKLLRVPGDFVELVQPKQQLDIPDGSDPETDEVEKLALDCALPAPLNRASWLEQSRGGGKRRPRVSELSETGEQCCKGNRSLELGPKIEGPLRSEDARCWFRSA